MDHNYDIAAYIWPSYSGNDKRASIFWPEGYGEWQTVKAAAEKPEKRYWKRQPLWGYVNEADPYVMEMQINAAVDHGVNIFLYDWYWYDRRPFLEGCLNDGFLQARNRNKMKFYLMWANHDVKSAWDTRRFSMEGYADESNILWNGMCDRQEFDRLVHRFIEKYFSQPNYYTIDGKPVLMFYVLGSLISEFGGVDGARAALDYFRNEVVKAGFPGLHLQAKAVRDPLFDLHSLDSRYTGGFARAAELLQIDSITHYNFNDCTAPNRSYPDVLHDVKTVWNEWERSFAMPFYPCVALGWDTNPRYKDGYSDRYITTDTTPENIERAFRAAKEYVDTRDNLKPKLIVINSWNEWTETSYLQPDTINGYGYLQALKRVFLDK